MTTIYTLKNMLNFKSNYRLIHIIQTVILLSALPMYAQKYRVVSFEIAPNDLSAKTNPRLDNNGIPCALIKIPINDAIDSVQGNVVGEVERIGLETNLYMTDGSKELKLIFANHLPIHILFKDYKIDGLHQSTTYLLKLSETDSETSIEPIVLGERAFEDNDYETAMKIFKEVADDPTAQYFIGKMYCFGLGVDVDYSEALRWAKKSADAGNPRGQNLLGVVYLNGFGNDSNPNEALQLFKLSAENGDAIGQLNLANAYYSGKYIKQDYYEAYKWYKLSAEQGNAQSQACLGNMYLYGIGTSQNEKESFKWFELSAKQGNELGIVGLGQLYFMGKGVDRDVEKAAELFKKGAELGNHAAQFSLGLMYENGIGTPKNIDKAILWLTKSAQQGNTGAQEELNKLKQ